MMGATLREPLEPHALGQGKNVHGVLRMLLG